MGSSDQLIQARLDEALVNAGMVKAIRKKSLEVEEVEEESVGVERNIDNRRDSSRRRPFLGRFKFLLPFRKLKIMYICTLYIFFVYHE